MKIFLSAVESVAPRAAFKYLIEQDTDFKWNLMSYYYIRENEDEAFANLIRDKSKLTLIDSGAHSFQKGVTVDWLQYTKDYAEFIKKFDRNNVLGYFEMDVDNIIGYEKVLELRKILEDVSDKIIPVWHKNRGIEDFQKMCQNYAGKVIAITGFKNEDIKDDQYAMFLKYARKYNCKVHCLGMTRKKVLDTVPFDYTDSSSWLQSTIYGRALDGKKLPKMNGSNGMKIQFAYNYLKGMETQEYYYNKWKKVNND